MDELIKACEDLLRNPRPNGHSKMNWEGKFIVYGYQLDEIAFHISKLKKKLEEVESE